MYSSYSPKYSFGDLKYQLGDEVEFVLVVFKPGNNESATLHTRTGKIVAVYTESVIPCKYTLFSQYTFPKGPVGTGKSVVKTHFYYFVIESLL